MRNLIAGLYYYVIDRWTGFLGLTMLVVLLLFLFPPEVLGIIMMLILLLIYVGIALYLIVLGWS